MITDKVRVDINTYQDGIEAGIFWYGSKFKFLSCKDKLSKDRDNWIDITLPEAIILYKNFKVCIRYEDGWRAFMMAGNMVKGREWYELQVTVY
jgi:hypothetical protein